jgi:hypothetical protein
MLAPYKNPHLAIGSLATVHPEWSIPGPGPIKLPENSQIPQEPTSIPQEPTSIPQNPSNSPKKFMILRGITPPPFDYQVKLPGSSDLMQSTFGKGHLNHFFITTHKKFNGRNNCLLAEEPSKKESSGTSDQTGKMFEFEIPKCYREDSNFDAEIENAKIDKSTEYSKLGNTGKIVILKRLWKNRRIKSHPKPRRTPEKFFTPKCLKKGEHPLFRFSNKTRDGKILEKYEYYKPPIMSFRFDDSNT